MTKQDEIREGIKEIFGRLQPQDEELAKAVWEALKDDLADAIVAYLHSQGVVLKVDRELPECPLEPSAWADVYNQAQQDMKEAGYEAVEPLIKEEANGLVA